MPRILRAVLSIPLPANEFEAAEIMTRTRPHWLALLEALRGAGIDYDCELNTSEAKAPPKRRHRRTALLVERGTEPIAA